MGRSQLTEHQLELVSVLWKLKKASVTQVHAALSKDREIAPATVATMLNRLCKDGAVERVRSGRQFEYRALLSREQLQKSMMRRLFDRLFEGDGAALLSHLIREDQISQSDLDQAKKLLDQGSEKKDVKGA